MNVSLTPELEKLIQQKVEAGHYQTASEVVREGLRLLVDRDQRRELELATFRDELARRIAAARRGEFVDGDAALSCLEAKLQARLPRSE